MPAKKTITLLTSTEIRTKNYIEKRNERLKWLKINNDIRKTVTNRELKKNNYSLWN